DPSSSPHAGRRGGGRSPAITWPVAASRSSSAGPSAGFTTTRRESGLNANRCPIFGSRHSSLPAATSQHISTFGPDRARTFAPAGGHVPDRDLFPVGAAAGVAQEIPAVRRQDAVPVPLVRQPAHRLQPAVGGVPLADDRPVVHRDDRVTVGRHRKGGTSGAEA